MPMVALKLSGARRLNGKIAFYLSEIGINLLFPKVLNMPVVVCGSLKRCHKADSYFRLNAQLS